MPALVCQSSIDMCLCAAPIAGNIRRAEHFIGFLRRFVAHLYERMRTPAVVSEGPASFLGQVQAAVAVDAKTLR
jgi:DNA excision repair protein ERCC-2